MPNATARKAKTTKLDSPAKIADKLFGNLLPPKAEEDTTAQAYQTYLDGQDQRVVGPKPDKADYREALKRAAMPVATWAVCILAALITLGSVVAGGELFPVLAVVLGALLLVGMGIRDALASAVSFAAATNSVLRLTILLVVAAALLFASGAMWQIGITWSVIGLMAEALFRDLRGKAAKEAAVVS
jgi:lipid-A-disaccharide synthase-like uncharacterized protein